jgi:hypothetical protein
MSAEVLVFRFPAYACALSLAYALWTVVKCLVF